MQITRKIYDVAETLIFVITTSNNLGLLMRKSKFFSGKTAHAISAIVIVIIIVVAAIVVGVGVYIGTRVSTSGPNTSATATPAASSTPTPVATPTPAPSTGPTPTSTATPTGLGNATSYEFNATEISDIGAPVANLYYATKNLGTSNEELIWVVTTPSTGTSEYIINGIEQKAWIYSNGQWTDVSSQFGSQQSNVEIEGMLGGWKGSGGFTYTIPFGGEGGGDTVTFTNIQINPSLPDSSFQPPT